MNNLKEEIAKIHNFVNAEFDIEDNNELEAVKATLSLEKIEMLDNMLNDYKKSVNKLKRVELQRKAQAQFKKIGTNLRLEEFNEYEALAKGENISISQYVKNALNRFKTVSTDTNVLDSEFIALKGKYEALEEEKLALLEEIKFDNQNIKNLTLQKESAEKLKTDYFNQMTSLKTKYEDKKTELQKVLVENLNIKDLKDKVETLEKNIEEKELEITTLKSNTVFNKVKSKFLSFFKS